MEIWGFQSKNITQKPASHFLFNCLAALVRHSQAQKMSSDQPKPFQQILKIFSNQCLQPSITQQWIWLWV